jgi:hypothetical protein
MRSAILTAALFVLAAAPAQAWKFHYSHRFVATGHLVDHWTIDDPRDCGAVGEGTLTVDFTSVKPSKALVVIDATHNGEPNNTLGSWTLLAPGDAFGHITDIRSKPATGTIDLVDNTVPRPPSYGGDCGLGIDKSGCGTHPLRKRSLVTVSGYNRKLILGNLDGTFFNEYGECGLGSLDGFSSPPAVPGGNKIGELLIKMPKPSKLRTHKVVTVSATTHKQSSFGDPGSATVTDDVTRTFSVTFTRLR